MHDTTDGTEDGTPPQGFLPTVTDAPSSLGASTLPAESHTFVPFLPNVLAEATSAGTETPSTSTAEEAAEVPAPDVTLESSTQQGDEAEVEEVPPTGHSSGEEPEGHVVEGKATLWWP